MRHVYNPAILVLGRVITSVTKRRAPLNVSGRFIGPRRIPSDITSELDGAWRLLAEKKGMPISIPFFNLAYTGTLLRILDTIFSATSGRLFPLPRALGGFRRLGRFRIPRRLSKDSKPFSRRSARNYCADARVMEQNRKLLVLNLTDILFYKYVARFVEYGTTQLMDFNRGSPFRKY